MKYILILIIVAALVRTYKWFADMGKQMDSYNLWDE